MAIVTLNRIWSKFLRLTIRKNNSKKMSESLTSKSDSDKNEDDQIFDKDKKYAFLEKAIEKIKVRLRLLRFRS